MRGYYVKQIGSNRGKPRIWLEGPLLKNGGFKRGVRYNIHINGGSIVLRANPDGSRVISGKEKDDKSLPVIDLNSKELLALFDGMAAVRIVQREGEIHILPLATELRKKERLTRLRKKLESGEPLKTGAVCFGGGVLSDALHKGLEKGGVKSELAFAVEIRPELLHHAQEANPSWSENTIAFGAPVQELAFDPAAMARVPRVEVFESGVACSGASTSGRARLGTEKPEDHPEVGHLIMPTLMVAAQANPAAILIENVIPYASSASASIARSTLRDLGYAVHESVISGGAFNAHEDRKRWVMVAVTQGLDFSWDMIRLPEPSEQPISTVLDDIADDDPAWRPMNGLKAKQERDLASGNTFKMQVVTAQDTNVGVLSKGYAKVRSTDWKLAHPSNPDLLRQFTPAEHARLKQVPPGLIKGLCQTIAHEVLGQSVIYEPFVEVGRMLSETFFNFADAKPPESMSEFVEMLAAEFMETANLAVEEVRKPLKGVSYEGPVVINDVGMVLQNIGNGVGILHHRDTIQSSLIDNLKLGEPVRIRYSSNKQAPEVHSLSSGPPPSVTPEMSRFMKARPEPERAEPVETASQLDIFDSPDVQTAHSAPRTRSYSPRMG